MHAVLLGATGATGSALLPLLLQDDAITRVTVLVRRTLSLQHAKLDVVVADFDSDNWQQQVRGDVAFSCMGTTLKAAGSKEAQYKVDYTYQYQFARAARQNGASHFVLVSAGMANSSSRLFYSRIKGELEEAVKALSFPSLTIFRPGLLSRPGTDRTGEKIGEAILRFFNRLGLFRKMAPLPVSKLAALMLRYGKQKPAGITVLEPGRILQEAKAVE